MKHSTFHRTGQTQSIHYYTHPVSQLGAEKRKRILSAACYFGFAPLIWFTGAMRQKNLLSHHLLSSFSFFLFSIYWFVFMWVLTYLSIFTEKYVWSWGLEMEVLQTWRAFLFVLDSAHTLALVILMAAWAVSVMDALWGRMRIIPIISRMASNYLAINISVYLVLLVEAAVLYLSVIGIRAAQLVSAPPPKADVYVLYTVGGYIPMANLFETFTPPKWAVALAFYPMLDAGMEKWGEQSVKVLPLSEEAFKEAIQNGRIIFVASHGGSISGSITISYTPYRDFLPADVPPGEAGANLQYIYFAGCDTGDLEADWRQVLFPAEVKSFDRISYVDEHMLWVWFKSPKIIAGLH